MRLAIFDNFPRYRHWRFFFLGLGVGINLLAFLLVYSYGLPIDMGMPEVGDELQLRLDVGRLVIMLVTVGWWSGPLLVYLGLAQSKLGSIVIGVLSAIALLWIWADVFTETSSTVGIGILLWPPYMYVGVGVACALDAAWTRISRPSGGSPPASTGQIPVSDSEKLDSGG
jgi:hypothetical protein